MLLIAQIILTKEAIKWMFNLLYTQKVYFSVEVSRNDWLEMNLYVSKRDQQTQYKIK